MKISRRLTAVGTLVLAILVIGSSLLAYQSQKRDAEAAQAMLGPSPPGLRLDGVPVRDLNKNGRVDPYEDPGVGLDDRVADLLARMTLPEKAGLLLRSPISLNDAGSPLGDVRALLVQGVSTMEAIVRRNIRHFRVVGSSSPENMARWHNRLQEIAARTRLGIPITLSSEPRHSIGDPSRTGRPAGFSAWPQPLGLAATRDRSTVEQFARIANREYRAVGLRTALHPVADLAGPRSDSSIVDTFGDDAALVERMVRAYIAGFQGKEIDLGSVLCMTKHFPGRRPPQDHDSSADLPNGNEPRDSDRGLARPLGPFRSAIEAGSAQMMTYYDFAPTAREQEVATRWNRETITNLLREELGFDGVLCVDRRTIDPSPAGVLEWLRRHAPGMADEGRTDRFARALEIGIDQFDGQSDSQAVVDLVETGTISTQRLDRSVRRILRDKFRLGLFDDPLVDAPMAAKICNQPSFRKAAERAQRKSIVLLQNTVVDEAPLLPLSPRARLYVENVDPAIAARYATVVPSLSEADVALIRVRASLETGSPGTELHSLAQAKPTLIALYLDRAAELSDIIEHSAGILAHFGASDEALLDVAFGIFSPRGKLPIQLPAAREAPSPSDQKTGTTAPQPLFPFGFGLAYD